MGRTGFDERQAAVHRKRTIVSAVMIFVIMPVTILAGAVFLDNSRYLIISLMILLYTMLPFFMIYEKRKPKAREIVLIAMMTAITAAAHLFFHVTVPIPVGTAIVIISGISMGSEAGFLIGALARFVCNFYMGQGPWTPWQMFCWGLLGFLAGISFNKVSPGSRFEAIGVEQKKSRSFNLVMGPLICIMAGIIIAYVSYLLYPGEDNTFFGWRIYVFGAAGLVIGALMQRKRLTADNLTLALFTFFMTVIIYGGIMNLAAMFTSAGIPGNPISFNTLRALYISGLPYDLTHGALAAVSMYLIGNPMITKLERIKIKYGIYR